MQRKKYPAVFATKAHVYSSDTDHLWVRAEDLCINKGRARKLDWALLVLSIDEAMSLARELQESAAFLKAKADIEVKAKGFDQQ